MASYRVLIKPSAAKELEAVDPKKDRQRIVAAPVPWSRILVRRVARSSWDHPDSMQRPLTRVGERAHYLHLFPLGPIRGRWAQTIGRAVEVAKWKWQIPPR